MGQSFLLSCIFLSLSLSPGITAEIPNDFESTIPFMVGSNLHSLRFTTCDQKFFLDGVGVENLYEGEDDVDDVDGCLAMAKRVMRLSGASEFPSKAPDSSMLAMSLRANIESRTENVRDRCRKHFIYGGVGLLAYEDVIRLKADTSCNHVQNELLDFYVGTSDRGTINNPGMYW
jgi:hypothetical protein